MPETLGNAFLHIALVLAFYSAVISFIGGRARRNALVVSARNALWAMSALVVVCSGILLGCLLTDRFDLKYVHSYSSTTMPVFYKIAAFWGGQEGSLLFWILTLAAFASLALWRHRNRNPELFPYVITTLAVISTFFLLVLIRQGNPFEVLPFTPRDGRGLNPLLQNFYMTIHPPALFLGYVGMSVPFAFAMAALVSGRLDNAWVLQVRSWTLTAWFFLSLGNLLGASWAYEVLGWGGYWGWDPVENAAFIPWLTATAFLHSIIVQEKRGILKIWNLVLIVLSFLFTITGTFLTRSGIVSSVHAFGKSDIGTYFLVFMGPCVVVSAALIFRRRRALKGQSALDSFLSREAAVLFNNLVLVGGAFAILIGTLFPVFSEWFKGSKITLGPPFFNSLMIPIGLLLLFLTGVGPMVAWRATTSEQLRKNFLLPVGLGLLALIAGFVFFPREIYVNLAFALAAFVLGTIGIEYQRGISARRRALREDFATALWRLVAANRRRYGGYIVHFGVVLLFVGFAGSAFKQEYDLEMEVGRTEQVGRYTVRYDSLTGKEDANREEVFANFTVFRGDRRIGELRPARVAYRSRTEGEPPQPYTLVSIRRSLREDLYSALMGFDPDTRKVFVKFVINPLVQFVWLGGLFLILGTLVVMAPAGRREKVAQ